MGASTTTVIANDLSTWVAEQHLRFESIVRALIDDISPRLPVIVQAPAEAVGYYL